MKYCHNCNSEHVQDLTNCPSCNELLLGTPPKKEIIALEYAGLFRRFCSTTLDNLILGIPAIAIFFRLMIEQIQLIQSGDINDPEVFMQLVKINILYLLFFGLIHFLYSSLLIAKYGATLGQKIVSIGVMNKQGHAVDYKKSFLRALVYSLYNIPYIGGIFFIASVIMVIVDKKRQTLHDKLCKTVVVKL